MDRKGEGRAGILMAARLVHFADTHEKARWLDAAASLDAGTDFVRSLARRLVGDVLADGRTNADTKGQRIAEHLHRIVRDEIGYERDRHEGKRREVFADSQTVVQRGYDDCDGKSRLLVALVRALERPDLIQARIRAVFPEPDDFRHVQAELRWPGVAWRLGEVTIAGVGLGEDPKRLRRPDGSYPLAGPRRTLPG
jgi:hypothetical protein